MAREAWATVDKQGIIKPINGRNHVATLHTSNGKLTFWLWFSLTWISSFKHCSSFSKTNCICVLLTEIHSSHGTRGRVITFKCWTGCANDFTIGLTFAWLRNCGIRWGPHSRLEKWLSHKGGGSWHLLIYLFILEWVIPRGLPPWFHLMSVHGAHVWCYLVRPLRSLTHFLQPALDQTPFRWRPGWLAGTVQMKGTDGRDRAFRTLLKMPSHYNVVQL